MEIIIQPDRESASLLTAAKIARLVREKPQAVLGLSTGGSPLRVYQELVRLHREGRADFAHVTTFNLDEYLGLPGAHPASYRHFMQEHLFQHIDIAPGNTHIPDGLTPGEEVPEACRQYEETIRRAGGIDLQLLGIGVDGHIGFNEPSSSLASRTRIKSLTEQTLQDNLRFFQPGEHVPRHVITMGVGTIMEAREIVLLAFGANKAEAVAATVEGPITASVPASILQMHPAAKIILDEEAACLLKRGDYYRSVFASKPAWQQI